MIVFGYVTFWTRASVNNHAAVLCVRSYGLLRTDQARSVFTNLSSRCMMAKEPKFAYLLFLDLKLALC